MLSEDIQALGAFKKKAEYLMEFLAEEGQVEAAKFMFVVQGLLDHRVRGPIRLIGHCWYDAGV